MKVFISHSSKDEAVATKIASYLENAGLDDKRVCEEWGINFWFLNIQLAVGSFHLLPARKWLQSTSAYRRSSIECC